MLDQSTSYDGTPAGRELGLHTGYPGAETVHTLLHNYVTGFRTI